MSMHLDSHPITPMLLRASLESHFTEAKMRHFPQKLVGSCKLDSLIFISDCTTTWKSTYRFTWQEYHICGNVRCTIPKLCIIVEYVRITDTHEQYLNITIFVLAWWDLPYSHTFPKHTLHTLMYYVYKIVLCGYVYYATYFTRACNLLTC